MKKILKILLIFGTALILIVIGFLALVVHQLPSIKSVGEVINTAENTKTQVAPVPKPEARDVSVSQDAIASDIESVSPSQSTSAETTANTTLDSKGLDILMDESRPLSQFCKSLKNARAGSMDLREFGTEFKKTIANVEDADPRIEAILPMFRYMFRTPSFKDLIYAAKDAQQNNEDDYFDKASFYGKVLLAVEDLRSKKTDFELLADRGYLMLKMNDLIARRPELATDQRLIGFCDQTENAFNALEPVQLEQEKKNFERVLSEMQVDAKDIGYNPDYKTQFALNFDKSTIQLRGGWLEDVFKDPELKEKLDQQVKSENEQPAEN